MNDKCTLPLTGKGVVNRIITDRAVVNVTDDGLKLIEIIGDFTVEDIQDSTEPDLIIAEQLK